MLWQRHALAGLVFWAVLSTTVLAQGTINFNTRFPAAGVNAPLETAPKGEGPGPAFAAALYLLNAGEFTLIPGSITRFRDGSQNPLMAKYIEPIIVEVPGAPVGSIITVRVRAWWAAVERFEQAPAHARAESMTLTVGPLGGGPIPPADLPSNFTGFISVSGVFIPEARPWIIGLLGALIFACRTLVRTSLQRGKPSKPPS